VSYRPWHLCASCSCERSCHYVRNNRKHTPAASLHAAILDGLAPDGKAWHACQPCRSYIRAHVTQRVALVCLADNASRRDASMWFAPIGRRPRIARVIGSHGPPFRRSAFSRASRFSKNRNAFEKSDATLARSRSATRRFSTDASLGNFHSFISRIYRSACVLFQTFRRSFLPPLLQISSLEPDLFNCRRIPHSLCVFSVWSVSICRQIQNMTIV